MWIKKNGMLFAITELNKVIIHNTFIIYDNKHV